MTSPNSDEKSVKLRDATLDDLGTIVRCIEGLAEYERLAHECHVTEELLRQSLFSDSPVAYVILATVRDETAGFALWFPSFSTFLARPGVYLEDLFVFPEFRGRGIGRMLLTRLAAIAIERNYGRLEWSVLDWNVDAIRFYESLGAEHKREWKLFRVTGPTLAALSAGDRSGPSA